MRGLTTSIRSQVTPTFQRDTVQLT